jgi:hypothetical protein
MAEKDKDIPWPASWVARPVMHKNIAVFNLYLMVNILMVSGLGDD